MFLYHAKVAEPAQLERMLFGRRDTADWLEKIALIFAETGHATQSLLIGNRGMGKSHLISVLYHRLQHSEAVRTHVVIAYLEEDPYGIADYLDLLRRIIKAIAKRETNPVHKQALNEAHQTLIGTEPKLRISTAERILLTHLAGRRMLLLVENLNDIFAALGEEGQSRWRDFLQAHDNTMVCATSQAIFSDVQQRERPFFGFFHVTYLHKLNFQEARDLLIALARERNNQELIEYLDTPEGEGKLYAIFELTEGNHRLLVTFYEFFQSEFRSELSRTFLHTVDKMKPYYESFLKLLAPQQQKIVQFLVLERIPQTGKTIGDNCFLPATSVSKQMSELQRLGYVSSTRQGRDAYYEITEPMLRMCLESNENTDGILSIFVDFLGNLYSSRDLKINYLRFHLAAQSAPPDLQPKLADEAYFYGKALPRYAGGWKPGEEELEELRCLAEPEQALAIRRVVEESEVTQDNVATFNNLSEKGLFEEAEAFLNKVFPERLSAWYWHNLAILRHDENRLLEAETAYRTALEINHKFESAWYNLGLLLQTENRLAEAEIAYLKALEIEPNDYNACFNLGRLLITSGRLSEAKSHLQNALDFNPNSIKWGRHFYTCILLNDPVWAASVFPAYDGEQKSLFLQTALLLLGETSGRFFTISLLQHPDFQTFLKQNKKIKLADALQVAVVSLLKDETTTAQQLHDFHAALTQLYGQKKAFTYPLKFLHIGIRHLKENDPKALLELTLEERRVFEQLVLSKEEEQA